MYPLTDYHFFLYWILFFIAVFVSIYIPGRMFMKRFDKHSSITTILLSFCLGYIFWTAQGFLFGYLGLRWITYLYVLVSVFVMFKIRLTIQTDITYLLKTIRKEKMITAIIFTGMIAQSISMFGSHVITSDGIRFLGANVIDGVMHVSYIDSMKKTFPPIEPGAFNLPLQNYHYWLDLSIAELSRVWLIPGNYIFFQFLPLIISVVTAVAAYLLLKMWTRSKIAGLWSLFFLYFGGDAAYLFMYALHGTFGVQIPIIDNGMTQFLNMPHAVAKMLFIAGLIPFYQWIKTNEKRWGIVTILLFAPLIGFKVYFGIFALFGFGLVVLGKLIVRFKEKKKQKVSRLKYVLQKESFSLTLLLVFIVMTLSIYLPPNAHSGGLQYYPLEWPKLFINENNLNWRDWWLRMQVYESAHNIRNIYFYNFLAIIIALVSIHGTRLIGLWPNKKIYKLLGWEHILFFIPGIIIFHILGLTTLQAAGSFNVFNFFVVSTVVMSFFSALLMYQLTIKKKLWFTVLIVIIVLLTLPRAVHEVYAFSNSVVSGTGGIVSHDEVDAMMYIRNNTPETSIVQSHPNNGYDKNTPYVSYFSNRNSYSSGIVMLDSHGQPTKKFQDDILELFELNKIDELMAAADSLHINYLYLQKDPAQKMHVKVDNKHIVKRYENKSVIILELKP